MKKFIATTLFLLTFVSLKAQDVFFSLYRQNHVWLNPAAAGAEDKHVFSLSGKMQTDGDYKTALLTYDQLIKKINSGIGVVVSYDRERGGVYTEYYSGINYNYKIKLADNMHLAIGAQAAFVNEKIANQYFLEFNEGFFIYQPQPLPKPVNYIDFDGGVWYTWSDFYAGVSIKHITQPEISFYDGLNSTVNRNIVFTTGYTWKLSKYFSMIPSTVFMTQGSNTSLEVDDEFSFNDTYFVGAGIKSISMGNPLKLCWGVNCNKKVQVMMAYDFSDGLFSHTLEANIKYRFK